MSNRICFAVLLLITVSAKSQFKNDNVLYTTVDPAELCDMLKKNSGYLLLDVRSKGEHNDTSRFSHLNLGHFGGATNIDIGELDKRWREISQYKDKPVFVYCSHSQRSRRAGKLLADSGFTKVFNVNGGMTAFHYKSLREKACVDELWRTHAEYGIISANQLCLKKEKGAFILDVRSDSAFRHISRDAKANAFGIIKDAVNIPLADLPAKLSAIPKGKEIIVTDMYGDEAAKASVILKQNGYEKVFMLIEGIDRILYTDSKDLSCRDRIYVPAASYAMFNATEFGRYTQSNNRYTMLDVRSVEEYENRHKDSWRNIGHIKNAVHIPADAVAARLDELDKTTEIVVYGFGTGTEVYATADLLQKNGFKTRLLVGGIFNLRWSSGNVKGQEWLRTMVVDVPVSNQ